MEIIEKQVYLQFKVKNIIKLFHIKKQLKKKMQKINMEVKA